MNIIKELLAMGANPAKAGRGNNILGQQSFDLVKLIESGELTPENLPDEMQYMVGIKRDATLPDLEQLIKHLSDLTNQADSVSGFEFKYVAKICNQRIFLIVENQERKYIVTSFGHKETVRTIQSRYIFRINQAKQQFELYSTPYHSAETKLAQKKFCTTFFDYLGAKGKFADTIA
jgi:hypothetical protein